MHCHEAQELITARVDGELRDHEQLALDAHLESCRVCSQTFAAERNLKGQIALAGRQIKAPAVFRRAMERKIAATGASRTQGNETLLWLRGVLRWRPAVAAAILLAVLGSLLYTTRRPENLAHAAMQTHASIVSGKTVLARSNDAAALREQLAGAVDGRFKPVALDLSLMKLQPVSGFVQRIGERDVLVTVYQGDGPAVTCFTFLGSEADAPDGAERFYDAAMRLNFYSFSQAGVNGLLHREADVICLLVSKMPAADLLAIVRGKSGHA